MKYRDFYMDTDILDRALNSCDLGDGYSAQVRQYPHKDHIKYYTRVIEHQAYTDLKQQADMLYEALDLAYNDKDFNWNYDVVKEALKNYESFLREIYEEN